MVEELKLAIKVDDDAIEQSLLKQFANAEKMANKVVLTFNNIDLDDKAIEAKFKEMQKMAGKNPIDLSIDKSSIEMLSAISKQLGNIFNIAKGKSIIDSSATAQIDKLQSKLDELTKKYDELSSKKIGSTVSSKDIDLVNNAEFKRLSDEFSLLKDELTGLKREMQLFEEATVSADTFVTMERNVNGLIVKVDDLIDKYVQLSVAQKNIDADKSNISSGTQIKDVFQGDDKVNTNASTTAIKEESQALEQVSASAKDAASSKEKFAKANKEVKASSDETVISVDKEINALEKAGSKFESQAAGLAIKPDDQHQFSSWTNDLDELNAKIEEYNSKVKYLKENNITDENQIAEVKSLRTEIENTIKTMSKTSQSERGWTQIGVDKAIQKMNDDLKKNSNYTKETKRNIEGLITELKNIPDRPLSEVLNDFYRFKREAHDAKREGKAFFEIFKEKVIYGGAAQLAGMFGFYDIINIFRDGIDTLKEFDNGLTKISYTMDMTKSQLNDLGKSVLDMANDLDSSINNAMQVSQIYANMNTSAEEIKKLSEPTLILSNLTGFDASTVADDIQAVTQQFDIAAEESMHIADVYDQISRNISVDYSKILELILETI